MSKVSSRTIKMLGPSILRTAAIPLLCIAYVVVTMWQNHQDERSLQPFPPFQLPVVKGHSQVLGNGYFVGQPFLAIFWASWCEPCKKQREILDPWALKKKQSYRFLGIATLDQKGAIEAAETLSPHPFPSVFDDDGILAQALHLTALPYAVLVDPKGRILRRYTGPLSIQDLEAMEALVGP